MSSAEPQPRYVPLFQTHVEDLYLRAENILAIDSSNISPGEHILWLNELPNDLTELSRRSAKYALVDHNRLISKFAGADDSVIAVMDHHTDEGYHKSAEPRRIQVPTGSTSSLVTEHFFSKRGVTSVPTDLADLLLGALLIDTKNITPAPKGKAVDTDLASASFLFPYTTLGAKALHGPDAASFSTSSINGKPAEPLAKVDNAAVRAVFQHTFDAIADKKFDLTALNSRDLLRRDYKEYESNNQHIRYGISSVPMPITDWVERQEIGNDYKTLAQKLDDWGAERDLRIVCALTNYNVPGKEKRGKAQVYLLRTKDPKQIIALRRMLVFMVQDSKDILNLKELDLPETDITGSAWEGHVFVYRQKETDPTRKQVAPALEKAVSYLEQGKF